MTSAADKEPFELFLQFSRDSEGGKTYADLPKEPLKYQRHFPGGTVSIAELAWDSAKIVKGLAELRKDPPNEELLAALGDELWAFVRECGAASAIEAASRSNRPIRITLLSAAAELYALPWELLRINAGPTLAQLDDCTIRYTWTSEETPAAVEDRVPLPEGGRILFAWSHGEDEVPWKSHLEEIEKACGKIAADEKTRIGFFDPQKDVLPHASYKALKNKLARAVADKNEKGETFPYRIVHLLCHGGELENSKGLGLLLTSDDETTLGNLDNTSLEKTTLSPDKLMTLFPKGASAPQLVVLCACLGSDSGQPDSRLGSVALATHRAGIESVISSRFLLSKGGSITLCKELYTSLLGGPSSIEAALRAARAELHSSPDHAALQLFQNTTGWDTRPVVFRPYRGLLIFGLAHQRYFFGRDAEIKETVEDLSALMQGSVDNSGHPRSRFLIVAAASGTGKSSMVFAGALPQLIKKHHFEWATMRAVADPMAALDAVLGTRRDSAKPFLVIVDQFEEVFTQIEKPEQRTEFVRALWQHASGDSGISVIVTLRVDFLGRCKEIVLDEKTGLRLEGVAYDEAHRVWVRQMERTALEEIIQKPADLVGITFDEGLVDRVLDDAGLEPGALPLVEYTLDQLWEKRERKNGCEGLTWDTYKTLGGVTGALTKKADAILAGFDEMGKRAARRLLVQLVDMREEAALDTRRRVRKDELFPGPGVDEKAFGDVLETLTRERLVVVGKDEAAITTMDFVEIAHEQLVRSWGTLRGWLNEDRQRVLECKPLEEWVETARRAKAKSTSYFLRDGDLALACEIRKKHEAYLNEEECELVTGSEKEAERLAEAERQRQEAERQKQEALEAALKRVRLAVIAIAVTAVFMGVLAVVASRQTKEAKKQTSAAASASALATKNAGEAKNNAIRARDNALMAGAREFLAIGPPGTAALLLGEVANPEKARGWFELSMSALESGGLEVTLPHDGRVMHAAWSPDGKHILTTSEDKTARVWNADGSGDPVVLKGHTERIWSAAWSPDGKRIVTASMDKTARVWKADGSGEPVVLGGHTAWVLSAAWSPDGKRIVTASLDKTARVWNADGSGEAIPLNGHTGWVLSAAWSFDGKRIVTASDDKTARLWTADNGGDAIRVLKGHEDRVVSAAWSPDGKRIVTASMDKTARVWNADGSGEALPLNGHTEGVFSASWSSDGTRIVTVSEDKTTRVWNADDGEQIHEVEHAAVDYAGGIVSPSFSPDGKRILTASKDGMVRISTADGEGRLVVLKTSWKWPNYVAWSPDGKRIVTASEDGTARVWHANGTGNPLVFASHRDHSKFSWSPDGKRVLMLSERSVSISNGDGSGDPVQLPIRDYCVGTSWAPDGKRIVMLSSECAVRNADGSGEPAVLKNDNKPIGCAKATWSPDGNRIVTASDDKTVRVWDADGWGKPVPLRTHSETINSAAWSPDGKRIVIASEDNTAQVWNADGSGEPIVMNGHTDIVTSAEWSPDGKRIVTTSGRTAMVWNPDAGGQPLYPFKDHTDFIEFAVWSPKGKRIVTTSDDKTAQVWNADGSGTPVILRGHEAAVRSAAWSPDGKRIVTASDDGTIRIWNADGSGDSWVIKAAGPAAWSPDGTRILTGSGTNEARSYLVDIPLLQQALRNATTDCLTPDQRETYLLESESDARKAYAECKTKNGRTP